MADKRLFHHAGRPTESDRLLDVAVVSALLERHRVQLKVAILTVAQRESDLEKQRKLAASIETTYHSRKRRGLISHVWRRHPQLLEALKRLPRKS